MLKPLSLVVIVITLFFLSNPSYGCGTNPELIQTNSITTASIYYEIDYYKIVLPVAGKLHVYATNVDWSNVAYTAGKLKNNSCVTIASDSGVFDFTDTNFTITENLNPGTYYIEVSRSSSANEFISERGYYLHADFTLSAQENPAFLESVYHLLFSDNQRNTKTVFISSSPYNGNLGGLSGADAICQFLADNAGLSGDYKAWLSDANESPSTRFTHSTWPYVDRKGTLIADNWENLVSGSVKVPITVTEYGTDIGLWSVWTGTGFDGTHRLPNCDSWTSDSSGEFGVRGSGGDYHDDRWSYSGTARCNGGIFLYCIEQ